MKNFESRMIKRMERRDKMDALSHKPRTVMVYLLFYLTMSAGLFIFLCKTVYQYADRILTVLQNPDSGLLIMFVLVSYFGVTAFGNAVSYLIEYRYQRNVRRFQKIQTERKLKLSQIGNDLRTNVPVFYGKLDQK